MLFFVLLFSAAAHAGIELRLLECAKTLARANEWVVPMASQQSNYASMYDGERHLIHFWSKKNPRNIYFYSGDQLYVAEAPPALPVAFAPSPWAPRKKAKTPPTCG